jgi:coenzyme F420-0:L-glutamate ligase/coenzyme F420-1:gamma-L-glutamate ligase
MNSYKNDGIHVIPVKGMPEVAPKDDLAEMIVNSINLLDGDVIVVTQKIVSKAEGRLVEIDPEIGHKPIVEKESIRVIRRRGDLIISETEHGFVCANAGIDLSNVESGQAALLPKFPDKSAKRIHDSLLHKHGVRVAVIISDTFGRPWRRGVTDIAIGSFGLSPIIDLRGTQDALGRELQVTEVALVDELASAAELVMGKAEAIPVAVIRGINPEWLGSDKGVVSEVVRSPEEDLFR